MTDVQWHHIVIILAGNSVITKLQKLWILYYMPIEYSSVLFKSLHYYRRGLVIVTRK